MSKTARTEIQTGKSRQSCPHQKIGKLYVNGEKSSCFGGVVLSVGGMKLIERRRREDKRLERRQDARTYFTNIVIGNWAMISRIGRTEACTLYLTHCAGACT